MPFGFITSEAYYGSELGAAAPTEHGRPSLTSRNQTLVMRAMCSGEPWQALTMSHIEKRLVHAEHLNVRVMATSACMSGWTRRRTRSARRTLNGASGRGLRAS